MYAFSFHDATGVLTVSVDGMWTLPEVERFGRECPGAYARARQKAGVLRLLIDNHQSHVLHQEVIGPLTELGRQVARPGDRVATLASSHIMKLQVRRLMEPGSGNVFTSREAALAWLVGDDDVAGEEERTDAA